MDILPPSPPIDNQQQQRSSSTILIEAKKNDDEHLFLHMPEGGSKLILPLPLFLPFPFPIIEDVEKIYHRKKVLVLTEHKPKKKKHKAQYKDFHHYDLGKGYYDEYKHDYYDHKYIDHHDNYKPPSYSSYSDPYYGKKSSYYEPNYNGNYDYNDHGNNGHDNGYEDRYYHNHNYDELYHEDLYKPLLSSSSKSSKYSSDTSIPLKYASSSASTKEPGRKKKSKYSTGDNDEIHGQIDLNNPLVSVLPPPPSFLSSQQQSPKSSSSSIQSKRSRRPSPATKKYSTNNKDDYEASSSDSIPSVYDKHSLDIDDDYSIKELYKPKKKKKISVTGPMSEFDDDPTKHYPYDPDETDDVEHVEFTTDEGQSQDINPTTIMDKIRKFLTQENVKLKVNIDYNKRKRKRERKEEPKQRQRSIGKMIDEQIKKLEDDEYDFH
ncbi:hypothetical protein DERP_010840 [Dermatophagoides pteronyssinus]|uniref:Uncharacterized protein n=1 Tax=Dermatophagoides pteronyssinus TaxID=6956 RepID=A0ABQ8JUH1_DERPT|nr:hypothetical protein DERP_010840 [Dermatophagoides pteronyssinus]